MYAERLVIRFKTADDREAKAILRELIEQARAKTGVRSKGLAIDGTSERYFAGSVKREFSALCPVEILVSSESMDDKGQRISKKAHLGNLYSNAYDDREIAVPPDRWVKEDRRLAKKVKGSFDNELDSAGNHGDTFDAGKNALYILSKRGGQIEAHAVSPAASTNNRTMFG